MFSHPIPMNLYHHLIFNILIIKKLNKFYFWQPYWILLIFQKNTKMQDTLGYQVHVFQFSQKEHEVFCNETITKKRRNGAQIH